MSDSFFSAKSVEVNPEPETEPEPEPNIWRAKIPIAGLMLNFLYLLNFRHLSHAFLKILAIFQDSNSFVPQKFLCLKPVLLA